MRFSAYFHAAMTRYQLSQVSAMKQVRLVLNRFRAIWQSFAALGVQEAALGSTVELILALAQEQERDNKGIRADKMHLTDLLTDGIMAVAGPLGAWAMVTSNARVRQQAEVYPSYLKKEASERLLLIAKDILALGTTHVADAADYALTQPGLDVLRSRIVTFEQLVVAPREGVARTAALTLLIEAEVERGMELLRGFFDRIMYRFKESDTEFYTNYQTARKVIRPSYRSRGEAEAETEEEGNAEGKADSQTATAKARNGSETGRGKAPTAPQATEGSAGQEEAEAPVQPPVQAPTASESEEATFAEVQAVLGGPNQESAPVEFGEAPEQRAAVAEGAGLAG